jgi:toxin-antitoxin system PIN domain toxin
MIVPDVNLLIHAHHADSPRYARAKAWWDSALNGNELVGLPWVALLGFIRITTNRRVFPNPLPVDEALSCVEAWLALPHIRVLHPTRAHATTLFQLLRREGTAGNLTTDAHLAAIALEHGAVIYTADTDFARFPGVSWRNPLV